VFFGWNFVPSAFFKASDDKKITLTYIPSHFYHMLFELLKVSLCSSTLRQSLSLKHG